MKICPSHRPLFYVAIAVAIATACASGRSARAEPANSFVVRDVTLFDGQARHAHVDVLVRDGRIAAVGAQLAAPAGLAAVDGRGKTLLPGLIDAHVHSWGESRREALRFGVTSELDMFTDPAVLPAAKAQRERVVATQEADLWSAGVLATAPGGHGTEYGFKIPTLTNTAEAEGFVADRVRDGSDYLKIVLEDGSAYGKRIATLDAATVAALAASGHAHGLMSVAHVATARDAAEAFAAGVDGLAHVFGDRPLDAQVDAGFIATAAHGHFVVATLAVLDGLSGGDSAKQLRADPRVAPWLDAQQQQMLAAAFPPGWTQAHFIEDASHNIGLLHAAGVPVLAGTDAGNPGTAHGASLHAELALLVHAGLTPAEALAAATSEPARIFKLADRGSIAPGLRADLLLVDGDPTVDITATRAIATIWMNGYAVDRGARNDVPTATAPQAAAAPADPLIADFDAGSAAARVGSGFAATTDQMIGGKSSAELAWTAAGAQGPQGFLNVHGTVDGGLPYAWAGAFWMAAKAAMEPVDYGARKTLVFKVRGPVARQGVAMLFSGPAAQGRPAMLPFAITPEWTEVRLPLGEFPGAEPARLRGLAITVGLPAGPYSFDLDDVSIQ